MNARLCRLKMIVASIVILAGFLAVRFVKSPAIHAQRPADDSAVEGTVKFEGAVPKPVHIDMSVDPECAKQHPGRRRNGGCGHGRQWWLAKCGRIHFRRIGGPYFRSRRRTLW